MPFFDFSLQLSPTRACSFSLSSFYTIPRPIQHNVSSCSTLSTPSLSRPMPQTSPRMPLELVLSFIEAASTQVDTHAYVALLRACSLVCRAWSTPAQRILFSQVSLRSQRSYQLFMSAVDRSTPHGAILGDAVKRLSVVLDHNQPLGLHPHSFALAVNACPKLAELDISLYGCAEPGQDIVGSPDVSRLRRPAPSFDEQTLSLLKAGPRIDHLHFDNWSENQQSIFQLLEIWPSLQFLSIGGTSPKHLQSSPPPFPCSLRGLRLNFQTTPSVDFLKWLLHNSTGSLRTLHFQRDPSVEALEYLVNAHGSSLKSMSLPAFGSPELPNLVSKCNGLVELRTENPLLPPSLYKCFPRQVEHLAFGLDRDTPLNFVIDVIKTNESLKTIDVQQWESGRSHSLLPSLKMACVYQGIELKITSDLRAFRTLDMTVRNRLSADGIRLVLMSSSLSSVVSSLVRASMGTSVPATVTDDDLDRHVAELIVREAKKKAERYGQQGIRAYISSNVSDPNAPKPNKRFLSSIIKSTDDHNRTILKAQAQAAQEVKREREEQERRQRRARAEEAAEAERLRRSGRSSKRKRANDEDGWDRWDGRTAERKKVSRNWEVWDGYDEDEDSEKPRRRRRSRSKPRSKSRARKQDGSSRTHHFEDDEKEEGSHRRRHRRGHSRSTSPRRIDSTNVSRDPHDEGSGRHKHHRSRERYHPRRSNSRSPARRHRSRSQSEDSNPRKRKRSRSPKYALDDIRDDVPSKDRRSSSLLSESRPSSRRTDSRGYEQPGAADNFDPAVALSSKRSSSPAPSRSPSPGPQPAIQLPSKMDRYFEESYDPRLDVAPLTAPKVPATGLIDNAEFEGWDAMLELIRIRREDKEEKKRLERLGLLPPKEKSKSKKSGVVVDSGPAVADRWAGETASIMNIEYKKRGSVREWDMGKEGF
ncbi:hypothetical protein JR316_0000523 [Psilocybe cubensis]|uniref:Uncharacterized protein n=2 Tax=Psilocybe cubensis TaxID=181762 RepID=A0A8H7Y5C5_PSICU|nr:hypothetical protein JR316_0000523 [Psilocybe cubensis]KAH9486458.1 hypothetical protein JR316_0000523 [Psilocybe cubensis]